MTRRLATEIEIREARARFDRVPWVPFRDYARGILDDRALVEAMGVRKALGIPAPRPYGDWQEVAIDRELRVAARIIVSGYVEEEGR